MTKCLCSSVLVVTLGGSLLVGCAGSDAKMSPVSGKVTYQGSPVEGALVRFIAVPSSVSASGVTDAQGEYHLTTYNANDGAVIGEHSVAIEKLDTEGSTSAAPVSTDPAKAQEDYLKTMAATGGTKGASPPRPNLKNLLPTKYGDPKKSGLQRTVASGQKNSFTFDLTD